MTARALIRGAGGGGGKGGGGSARTAQESPDNLRSRSYARVIDLVCEGEIEGPGTGDILTSTYLDKTVIKNDDGSFNFTGITVATRNGTQGQTYIPGFASVESERAVDVRVHQGTPVVRAITDSTYTHARVTISVPQLTSQNTSNGDISGTSVEIGIDLQPNGGSFTEVVSDTISGKTTTRYQRSYLIQLTGTPPWNIRVRRVTEDSEATALQNTTSWDSYTEIVDAKLRYPNSALVASIVDSQQFSSIPTRGFDMKMLRIRIPSNATVRDDGSLTYSGSWDGTFQIAWSANPAWCFYDMLTNDRYGLGAFIDASQVDKWELYTIGQYCDELISDGFGGTEPRFTCNLYLQTRAEAYKVLTDMASVFRGMSYWASGQIIPVQDSPADPVALYSNANVIEGLFTYSGTSLKTRHSVALVTWNDPDDFYARKVEYVEDAAAILRYGVVSTDIVATGCTSRGQAHRVGKWLLYSEANETETVSFKTGLDGVVVRPGNIISVQDADRAGIRLSGRVASATTTSVTVDSAFTPDPSAIYTLSVMLPDGTVGTAVVTNVTGAVLTLGAALPSAPVANAIWMLDSDVTALQQFRVVAVSDGGDGTYEISGVQYTAEKYDAVEDGVVLIENPISVLTQPPAAPDGLSITESLYLSASEIKVLVTIAWNATPRAASYSVSYQRDNGNLVTMTVGAALCEIRDAQPGTYTVVVKAVNDIGKTSVPSTVQAQVFGKTAPPSDVQDFSLVGISDGVAHLTWTQSTDLDVVVGGYIFIRYSPETSGATWATSVNIGPALAGSATSAGVPHVNGTYLAKFIDSSGYSSTNAATITTISTALTNLNVVDTITESPSFAGTHTDTIVDTDLGGLKLAGTTLIDDFPLIDTVDDMDAEGGVAAIGTYDFEDYVDLGAVYTAQVTATIGAFAYDANDIIDGRESSIDDWPSIDGSEIDDVNASLYVSITDDDPAGSPTWSSYRPFFVGQYTARAYRFQLILTSGYETHNIVVTSVSVTIDMPDRTEAESGIVSGASTKSVTFPNAFWVAPAVGIAPHNMGTGDYYTLSAQTADGFSITFRNSGGTVVSRTFDYMAKGYGRQN